MTTAQALLELVTVDRDRIVGLGRSAASALVVHTALQRQPVVTVSALVKATGISAATVNKVLVLLEKLGMVAELTAQRRGRVFAYSAYIGLINAGLDGVTVPVATRPLPGQERR